MREKGAIASDFHKYQIILFILTTIAYIPIVGSLLSSNFFDPSKVTIFSTIHRSSITVPLRLINKKAIEIVL